MYHATQLGVYSFNYSINLHAITYNFIPYIPLALRIALYIRAKRIAVARANVTDWSYV